MLGLKTATIGVLIMLAGCAPQPIRVVPEGAAATVVREYQTTAGTRLRLNFAAAINPDCSSMGLAKVEVTTPPGNGTVEVVEMEDYVSFPPTNARSACNARRVRGLMIFYTANPGFHGSDGLVYSVTYPAGNDRTSVVSIRVR